MLCDGNTPCGGMLISLLTPLANYTPATNDDKMAIYYLKYAGNLKSAFKL